MSLDGYGDVLNTTNPGHTAAWPTNPTRTTLRQRIAGWIGLDQKPATDTVTEHTGADETWADEIRAAADQIDDTSSGRHYADNIATTLLRRPIAAITATGHWAVYDEQLGGLNPEPDKATPFHDAIARCAAAGHPITNEITTTTGEKDQ